MRGLKIVTFNIVSLLKHIDELQIAVAHNKIDILAINGTRLDSTISDKSIALSGYKVFRKDRNRFGGGVALYVLNSMNTNLRPDLSADSLEAISVEILKPNSKPFIITACYRPPNAVDAVFDELDKIVATVDAEDKEFILMGDLNCNFLADNSDHSTSQLRSICEVYQLQQLINSPTRITESTSTLIDLILTNMPSRIVSYGVTHTGIIQ